LIALALALDVQPLPCSLQRGVRNALSYSFGLYDGGRARAVSQCSL
jgi:hypothetical protein